MHIEIIARIRKYFPRWCLPKLLGIGLPAEEPPLYCKFLWVFFHIRVVRCLLYLAHSEAAVRKLLLRNTFTITFWHFVCFMLNVQCSMLNVQKKSEKRREFWPSVALPLFLKPKFDSLLNASVFRALALILRELWPFSLRNF